MPIVIREEKTVFPVDSHKIHNHNSRESRTDSE
jgi:hypothetical protein